MDMKPDTLVYTVLEYNDCARLYLTRQTDVIARLTAFKYKCPRMLLTGNERLLLCDHIHSKKEETHAID